MSKGDRPRPIKDQKKYNENFDKIFNKNKDSEPSKDEKNHKEGGNKN